MLKERKSAEQLLQESIQRDKALIHKFEHILEGVSDHVVGAEKQFHMKRHIARLMESQEEALLKEDTQTGDIATFQKYALPLIRRIYPTLPINDLVGIQPLSGPSGLIFTMEAKYTDAKAPHTAGQTIFDNASTNYASSEVDGEVWKAAGTSTTSYSGTLGWKPVVPGSVTVTINTITGTDDGAGAITGTGINAGTINYATGAIALTLAAGNTNAATATYKYNSEANTQIPEIELDITSTAVVAESRKLRAKWSPEAQQDLNSQHGVDGETTFVAEIANSIQREISRAVVELCRTNVPTNQKQSWSRVIPDGQSYDQHKRTLIDTLGIMSRKIGVSTRRGKGNVLVAGSDGADVLDTLPGFVADSGVSQSKPGGKTGTLNGRWTVLEDIDMASDKILIGYKGDTFMDTGVVYAPYVALTLDTFVNPDDFKVRKGFMTRDALKAINGKFYAEVSITGTPGFLA